MFTCSVIRKVTVLFITASAISFLCYFNFVTYSSRKPEDHIPSEVETEMVISGDVTYERGILSKVIFGVNMVANVGIISILLVELVFFTWAFFVHPLLCSGHGNR